MNEEGNGNEEVTKGRRRKKTLKVDDKDTLDVSGEAGPAAEEVDSITATIEAVLANASSINIAALQKKTKRVKKQEQEGDGAKTPKQDAEMTADDADENDDDSSTAGSNS